VPLAVVCAEASIGIASATANVKVISFALVISVALLPFAGDLVLTAGALGFSSGKPFDFTPAMPNSLLP
jgi:hypothetical protein